MASRRFSPFLISTALAAGLALGSGPMAAETLTDALITAYQTSPLLEANRAALRNLDENVPQARANRRPQVGASISGQTGTTVEELDFGVAGIEASLTATLLLFDNGQTAAAVEAARNQVASGRADLKDVLDQWWSYYNQCSECRRCSVFCPYGIDTAEITMAAREIMDAVGLGQKYANEIIGKVHRIGNNLGLPGPALEDTLEGLEEDTKDETGVDVRFPLDVKGAEVLLVTPSADFFSEPHVDSLIGYAKVFHAAGISWTLSSMASEAGNFGLFIGNYEQLRKIAMRIREAALELGVKRIVVGECGHAWRVAYSFWNTLTGVGAGGKDPFAIQLQSQLDPRHKQPTHICELTWDLIQRGALKFDKEKNDSRIVTFHDSCNVARASRMGDAPGGQFTIPRAIIRAVANHYVEMPEGTTHEATFCCGGGGGLLTDDLMEVRVKGALPRMEALKTVVDAHGVNFMATICAICKAQFSKVLPYYGFDMSLVGGVHQLVSKAIRL